MVNGSTFCSSEPFSPDMEGGFMAYMERIPLFLEVNELSEAKQVPVFLHELHWKRDVYGLLQTLLALVQLIRTRARKKL